MIDELEVGVKYKLVDKVGYLNSHKRNAELCKKHLTDSGCFILDYVSDCGYGLIGDDVVIDNEKGEYVYFSKFEESADPSAQMEYRVIRRANGHQVCDWRKGVALYEDDFGTLVRNDKRTKFYTDIVEWREVVAPVTPTASVDYMSELDKLSKLELQELLIRIRDMTTKAIQNKG